MSISLSLLLYTQCEREDRKPVLLFASSFFFFFLSSGSSVGAASRLSAVALVFVVQEFNEALISIRPSL